MIPMLIIANAIVIAIKKKKSRKEPVVIALNNRNI